MFGKDKMTQRSSITATPQDSRKIEIIEDALLESVSGGLGLGRGGPELPVCIGNQFCIVHKVTDPEGFE